MRNHKRITRACVALAFLAVFVILFTCCGGSKPAVYNETGNTVTFDYNDGVSRPLAIVVEENASVDRPADPVREGFTFAGWKTAAEGGAEVTFPYTPTADVRFYAAWSAKTCTVTLDYDYDGRTEVLTVNYGSLFSAPEAPARENYTLFSWIGADGEAASFPLMVRRDLTLKANWVNTTSVITVSFDLGYEGAENPAPKQLISGEEVTSADVGILSRTGYEFLGWGTSADAAGEQVFSLPYKATENVTLHAIWKVNQYTVTFRYNDPEKRTTKTAQTFTSIDGDFGATVTPPAEEPTRNGYIFTGWYGTAKGGEPVDFATYTIPARSADIYAHWEHLPVKTDVFQAEYVYIDPSEGFPGYSGNAIGAGIIQNTNEETADCSVDEYPLAYGQSERYGKYVSYLYKKDATLRFVVTSDKAVSGVTLTLNVSLEIATAPVTFSPEGDCGYRIRVNGTDLNYAPFTLTTHAPRSGAGQYKGDFTEVTLSTTVSLKEGENVIELITNNTNTMLGGTTQAIAPQVDYIKLGSYGAASLSWKPVYDNIY